jgi:hypothetical protein
MSDLQLSLTRTMSTRVVGEEAAHIESLVLGTFDRDRDMVDEDSEYVRTLHEAKAALREVMRKAKV